MAAILEYAHRRYEVEREKDRPVSVETLSPQQWMDRFVIQGGAPEHLRRGGGVIELMAEPPSSAGVLA